MLSQVVLLSHVESTEVTWWWSADGLVWRVHDSHSRGWEGWAQLRLLTGVPPVASPAWWPQVSYMVAQDSQETWAEAARLFQTWLWRSQHVTSFPSCWQTSYEGQPRCRERLDSLSQGK